MRKKSFHIPIKNRMGLPWWLMVKNLPANERDMGLIPDLGRSHMQWSN